jgi:hypothetical protein
MKRTKSLLVELAVATALVAAPGILYAQSPRSTDERSQIKRSIEVVEGVINTVRQQALHAVTASLVRTNDSNNPIAFFLQSNEGNRTEGIYLEGYGVIFEVGIPNFTEQRSLNFAYRNLVPGFSAKRATKAPVAEPGPTSTPSTMIMETASANTSSTLDALSKLIDNYTSEAQRTDKQAALRDLLSKLREKDFLRSTYSLEITSTSDAQEGGKEKGGSTNWNPEQQRKQLQDAIVKAVADYGSSIPGLEPRESVTILLKAPVQKDFSLFSPETRTSTIIRFTVRDLQDYKVGKISYSELQSKTKIEEN